MELLEEIKKHVDNVKYVDGVYCCEKHIKGDAPKSDPAAYSYHATIIIDNDKTYIIAEGPGPTIFKNFGLIRDVPAVEILKNIESYIFPKQKEISDKDRIEKLENRIENIEKILSPAESRASKE
jgi:hypothetical protein